MTGVEGEGMTDWNRYEEVQRLGLGLCDGAHSAPGAVPDGLHRTKETVLKLHRILEAAGTFALKPNDQGIYSASPNLSSKSESGYQYAWLRDNAMIAFARWFCGDHESAFRTASGLGRFLKTQLPRFETIIANPPLKEDVSLRPRVRFDPQTMEELPESWSNAQNDALGAALWLRYFLANRATGQHGDAYALSEDERPLYERIVSYLQAIEYWRDADSGAWEESRRVNCSSIGAVIAALREVVAHEEMRLRADSPFARMARELIDRGSPVLDRLPFESPPERKADASLLFLIYPYQVVSRSDADRILSLTRARLMGEIGIRRYIGDSYYCQDYDQWFPANERSGNFSTDVDYRDALLVPEQEAQWCIFDPLLSVIYSSAVYGDSEKQITHFRRSLRQLTANLQCPELYYLKDGRYAPSPHTPLGWTQANMSMAFEALKRMVHDQAGDQPARTDSS